MDLNDLPQPTYEGTVPPEDLEVDSDNPNEMPSDLFDVLCDRIQDRGWLGNAIVTDEDGVIADGEHRWRAAREIGLDEVPVKQFDLNDAERRIVRQELNKIEGEHDTAADAREYDRLLSSGYVEPAETVADAAGDDIEDLLDRFVESKAESEPEPDDATSETSPSFETGPTDPPERSSSSSGKANDPDAEWEKFDAVEYENEDQTPEYTIKVHLEDDEAREAFADLVGQTITEKTQSIHYPEVEDTSFMDKRYVNEADAE